MLRVTALLGAFAVAFTTGAWAQGGPYDDEGTPMGWAFDGSETMRSPISAGAAKNLIHARRMGGKILAGEFRPNF